MAKTKNSKDGLVREKSNLCIKFAIVLENYSPRMRAIVGAVLGHDFGVRDARGNRLVGISVTSDGFIIAQTEPISSGAFIGEYRDFARNMSEIIKDAKLTEDERAELRTLYSTHVTDFGNHPVPTEVR